MAAMLPNIISVWLRHNRFAESACLGYGTPDLPAFWHESAISAYLASLHLITKQAAVQTTFVLITRDIAGPTRISLWIGTGKLQVFCSAPGHIVV